MCGRTALGLDPALLLRIYRAHLQKLRDKRSGTVTEIDWRDGENYKPSYNCAPSTFLPVMIFDDQAERLEIKLMKWGLVPQWMKNSDNGAPRPINARSESIMEKPMFRASLSARRCLMLAQGFYEWKVIKGQRDRQPIYIAPKVADIPFPTDDLNKTVKTEEDIDLLAGHLPFFEIAGIYDFWKDPDTEFSAVHDRMPIMISPEDRERWLDKRTPMIDIIKMLKTHEGPLDMYFSLNPIFSPNRKNHGPELVQKIELPDPTTTGIASFFKDSPKKDPFESIKSISPKKEVQMKQESLLPFVKKELPLSTADLLPKSPKMKRESSSVKVETKPSLDFFAPRKSQEKTLRRGAQVDPDLSQIEDEVVFVGEKKRPREDDERDDGTPDSPAEADSQLRQKRPRKK